MVKNKLKFLKGKIFTVEFFVSWHFVSVRYWNDSGNRGMKLI